VLDLQRKEEEGNYIYIIKFRRTLRWQKERKEEVEEALDEHLKSVHYTARRLERE